MKKLNRNHLKLIALVSMLIDHVGVIFCSSLPIIIYNILRSIGRIAFPIFAYFIAEGFYYTKNRRKYMLTLLIFSIISQPIFYLITNNAIFFNVLITFLISTILMFLYDKFYREQSDTKQMMFYLLFGLVIATCIIFSMFNITCDYGLFGILLTFLFYVYKNNTNKQLICFLILLGIKVLFDSFVLYKPSFDTFCLLFELLSIPLICLYNNKKGNLNLKYLFYWFYPAHILLLYIIKLIIL